MSVREREEEEPGVADDVAGAIEDAVQRRLEKEGIISIPTPHEGDEIANLPVQVSIAVPSTEDGEQISLEEFEERIEQVKRWFSETFGGATTVRASGDYVGEDGELIEEAVALVEAAMSKTSYLEHYQEFGARIENAQEIWGQDTVFYRVEGRSFIYPDRAYLDDGDRVPPELVLVS